MFFYVLNLIWVKTCTRTKNYVWLKCIKAWPAQLLYTFLFGGEAFVRSLWNLANSLLSVSLLIFQNLLYQILVMWPENDL